MKSRDKQAQSYFFIVVQNENDMMMPKLKSYELLGETFFFDSEWMGCKYMSSMNKGDDIGLDISRTLLISSWAPPMVGGPQNLYNLFSQFSVEDYAIVTSYANIYQYMKHGVSGDILPCAYHYFDRMGRGKSRCGRDVWNALPQTERQEEKTSFATPKPKKQLSHTFSALGHMMLFVRKTLDVIREFNPSRLVGVSDTGPALVATYIASRLTGIPFSFYMFDLYKENHLMMPYRFIAQRMEKRMMLSSDRVIVTNEGTETFYKRQYGDRVQVDVLHNSVFRQSEVTENVTYDPKPPYRIVLTGAVYWPQEQSVLNMIAAMDLLQDLPVEFHAYIPNPPASIREAVDGKQNITLSKADQHQMSDIQKQATLLFIPFSWHTVAPDIIATASPGKLTDYLSIGRPLLVHAPEYAYVSRYCRKHNLGVVVDQNDVSVLADQVRHCLSDLSSLGVCARNGRREFEEKYDAHKNAIKLAGLLRGESCV